METTAGPLGPAVSLFSDVDEGWTAKLGVLPGAGSPFAQHEVIADSPTGWPRPETVRYAPALSPRAGAPASTAWVPGAPEDSPAGVPPWDGGLALSGNAIRSISNTHSSSGVW